MSAIERESKKLENEAARLIDKIILKLPADTACQESDRIVECIVNAAILRMADIMRGPETIILNRGV